MRYFYITFLFICLVNGHSVAQLHDAVWRYGTYNNIGEYNYQVDFTGDYMVHTEKYDTLKSITLSNAVADAEGNFLYASDGAWILNKYGEQVENSYGLNPAGPLYPGFYFYLGSSSFFLPSPWDSTLMLLFHSDIGSLKNQGDYTTYAKANYYSIIDTKANQGHGKVIQKNQLIMSNDTTMMKAMRGCRHANGRDWWIVWPDAYKDIFYRVLVSPQGVSQVQLQVFGHKADPGIPIVNEGSSNLFSPDGRYFLDSNGCMGEIAIFNFDRCTGLMTKENRVNFLSPQEAANVPPRVIGNGGAFSRDGKYLYYVRDKLGNGSVPNSPSTPIMTKYLIDDGALILQDTVNDVVFYPNWHPLYSIQKGIGYPSLAPDGRIYFGDSYDNSFGFGMISYPEQAGKVCGFTLDAFKLDTTERLWSPPGTFVNYRLGPLDGSPCDTLGLNNSPIARFRVDTMQDQLTKYFYDLSYREPAEWLWNFGDGATSTDTSTLHTFPSIGAYNVCLTVKNNNGSHTTCRWIGAGTSNTITPKKNSEQILVYPNPVYDWVEFEYPNEVHGRLHIHDMMGHMAIEQAVSGKRTRIETHTLAAGLYFWELELDSGERWSGKLIVIE